MLAVIEVVALALGFVGFGVVVLATVGILAACAALAAGDDSDDGY